MVNDTTTLNGALAELGETMAANLTQQGVTSSASEGLTTLAGKILDIQTGGSCYHIEFSEDSYVAVGGSATLEIMLQSNYQPLSGATVTVTGSDSSLYTGITDSTGLATVTVTGLTTDTSFTASYNNVSDTCTVTVSNIIYQPVLDGTETWYKINSNYTPTYSTVGGVNQVCDACGYLSDGWDNTINWKLTFEYYYNYTRWGDSGALVTFNNVTARDRNSLQFWGEYCHSHQGTGSVTVFNSQSVLVSEQWNKVEITKTGSNLTIVINDTNTYTVTNTDFNNASRTRAVIGLDNTGNNNHSCIRSIKVEAL